MLKTVLIITVQHSKPLPELTDLAAGRIYTLQGVEDVTVTSAIGTYAPVEKLEVSNHGRQYD